MRNKYVNQLQNIGITMRVLKNATKKDIQVMVDARTQVLEDEGVGIIDILHDTKRLELLAMIIRIEEVGPESPITIFIEEEQDVFQDGIEIKTGEEK